MGQDLTSSADLPCINHYFVNSRQNLLSSSLVLPIIKSIDPVSPSPHWWVFPAEDLFYISQLKDTQPRRAHICIPAWARDLNTSWLKLGPRVGETWCIWSEKHVKNRLGINLEPLFAAFLCGYMAAVWPPHLICKWSCQDKLARAKPVLLSLDDYQDLLWWVLR